MTTEELIRAVRLLVRDKPKPLRNINIGVGDGVETIFRVPVLTVDTLLSGNPDLTIDLFDTSTSTYTSATITNFDYETGDVQLSVAPASGIMVLAYFSIVVFTDDEIEFILGLDEISSCYYLAAAFCIQSIINDTSRMIPFSQGDANYRYESVARRLQDSIELLWKQSPLTSASTAVPFYIDVLSRVDYVPIPIVRFNSPYARF